MHWVDTNIIVRFLTHDDARQTPRAVSFMRRRNLCISKTVLLELAWVLRTLYEFPPAAIIDALVRLGGMQNVTFEDQQAVVRAVSLMNSGVDFEDALHVATCAQAEGEFVTFDSKLMKRAAKAGMKIITA